MKPIAFAALLVGLLAATTARADLGPPKGFKRLPLEHHIATEKDYPEYSFSVGLLAKDATPVKLDSKTPATVTGTYRGISLVAVPKDASKSYPTEKDFYAAVAAGKVEGAIKTKTMLPAFTEVKDTDTRKVGVMKYKLEKIDAKDGIVLVKDEPKPEEEEALNQPASRSMALGLALAGFMGFAGLVVVRRRKVA